MSSGKLQTLDRGIALLMLVARGEGRLKIADLADRLGLHRAIAYRIVATLADHGMVTRLPDGCIVLGSGAVMLGTHAEGSLRALARPVVEDLAEATGCTAFLAMAQGGDCVAILAAEPRGVIFNVHYRVGTRHPLERGASGLAILAGRPEQPDDPEPVRRARADGFALTQGELQKGAMGVSSPVRICAPGVESQAIAGIELSVGVVALETLDVAPVSTAVRQAARDLSALLCGA
ncbi:IclR family transcriptional regulator [Pseudodonghicola flavimaris]|uniref:Helix-turn-helix domain-containing protein n=1 Tax=Pseudodonghicola flavimaris TaxID=3050036 RepID=A0ABT7F5R5_9RHOB|nr:helix-turn-helix domain-containing protein [Pseudodonghicola flavimaris]MDK3019953.1 helix-turn-helix domain-containing protein [Pseudodonghicola flavimaris]